MYVDSQLPQSPLEEEVWILAVTMTSLFLWILLSEQNIITLLFHY